jgi:hypothetical protein
MTIRNKILRIAEAHRQKLGMAATAYSDTATGNQHFLRHLRDPDRHPGLRAVEALEKFIQQDPAGLDLSGTILDPAADADPVAAPPPSVPVGLGDA